MSRFAMVLARWQQMRQQLFILVLCILLSGFLTAVVAQVPPVITIPVFLEEGGVPVNGQRTIDVRWYTASAGGSAIYSESNTTTVDQGVAVLTMGTIVPISDSLLLQGPIWVGVSIDGGPELVPRTFLASVPYALLAQRSLVAESLAPEVTGVVTSLNELGGAIRLIGGKGATIRRDGSNLVVDVARVIESGTVTGEKGVYSYTIAPLNILEPDVVIHADVEAESHITTRIRSIDVVANTFTIETSAPLLTTEQIRWRLIR